MGKQTPCGACPKPLGIQQENEEAWELFQILATQPRVAGMGQIVGVDLTLFPYFCEIRLIPFNERQFLLDKVLLLSKVAVKHWNADRDEE
jgi:hypothetical protein